mmetsp:Transcript_25794/g.86677  ORF Transcript_25794/g.86677 Transcript_25794/m.86677 type:complete len:444 (+) Transcript_25794:598-1929(+)
MRRSVACAEQSKAAGQTTSSCEAARTVGVPQQGQASGSVQASKSPGGASSSGPNRGEICGMTSPARFTSTTPFIVVPRSDLRRVASLCRLAVLMVTPPTLTGSTSATGVSEPVRPTVTSMPTRRVASQGTSASNLCATAPRGALRVAPHARTAAAPSTLYTAPSISNRRPAASAPAERTGRCVMRFAWYSTSCAATVAKSASVAFTPRCTRSAGVAIPKPQRSRASRFFVYERLPTASPTRSCAMNWRDLRRVSSASSWRSEPAAALRGEENSLSPRARQAALSARNSEIPRQTSPRTSMVSLGAPSKCCGTPPTPLALAETSSPCAPSPRVAAPAKLPSMYLSDADRPSSLGSATIAPSSAPFAKRRALASHFDIAPASSPPSTLRFSSESMGTRCGGAAGMDPESLAPTSRLPAATAVRSAARSRASASYSASLITGAASL